MAEINGLLSQYIMLEILSKDKEAMVKDFLKIKRQTRSDNTTKPNVYHHLHYRLLWLTTAVLSFVRIKGHKRLPCVLPGINYKEPNKLCD